MEGKLKKLATFVFVIPQPELPLSSWVCQRCNELTPTLGSDLPCCRAHWADNEQWLHTVHSVLYPSLGLWGRKSRDNNFGIVQKQRMQISKDLPCTDMTDDERKKLNSPMYSSLQGAEQFGPDSTDHLGRNLQAQKAIRHSLEVNRVWAHKSLSKSQTYTLA